jgi:hypothetical protein
MYTHIQMLFFPTPTLCIGCMYTTCVYYNRHHPSVLPQSQVQHHIYEFISQYHNTYTHKYRRIYIYAFTNIHIYTCIHICMYVCTLIQCNISYNRTPSIHMVAYFFILPLFSTHTFGFDGFGTKVLASHSTKYVLN